MIGSRLIVTINPVPLIQHSEALKLLDSYTAFQKLASIIVAAPTQDPRLLLCFVPRLSNPQIIYCAATAVFSRLKRRTLKQFLYSEVLAGREFVALEINISEILQNQ